jgi:Spy/CpxP family protein refolding chaperone
MMIRSLLALAFVASQAVAFGGPGGSGGPDDLGPRPGSFLRLLYPPRIVMRYATDIDLTAHQKEQISEQVRETQKELIDVQWKLGEASNELEKLLEAERIDERATMAEAEKVMAIEQEVKERHLRLLIRIRNLLTPEQRAKLRMLRGKDRPFAPRLRGGPPEGENE